MTRLTAIIIQTRGDDVKCMASEPDKNGKCAGWIYLLKDGNIHTPLISTKAIYDSKEAAKSAMEEIVEKVRALTHEELFA